MGIILYLERAENELEQKKRESFTYQKIAQANKDPAKNSLDNARIFFRNIFNLLD
jgi:hypothetical protein